MKNTSGPWELDRDTRPAEVCTIHGLPPHGDEKQTYAYIRGPIGYWDADENENMANARLICAAPDMLEALRRAVLALAFAAETSSAMRDDYEAVSRAIAKATGAA